MKLFSIILIVIAFAGCVSQQPLQTAKVYKPVSQQLHDSIATLDSILFEAYNNCRISVFDSLMSAEIEFYHDHGGLSTSKPDLTEALRKNICGKVTRFLLPGSIEVYPIPGFGAVQFGHHRFRNVAEPDAESKYSKFVHIWKRSNTGWLLHRVISLH